MRRRCRVNGHRWATPPGQPDTLACRRLFCDEIIYPLPEPFHPPYAPLSIYDQENP